MLRDEIYLQIMKQLNNNPNPESVKRGWMLLICCLRSFIPVTTQNYLHNFIQTKAQYPGQLLTAMYNRIMYEQSKIYQINDIRNMLK